jgi:hypothetical protein
LATKIKLANVNYVEVLQTFNDEIFLNGLGMLQQNILNNCLYIDCTENKIGIE